MCKTDEKTGNIISLPRDKMSYRSWENWLCETHDTSTLEDKNEIKYNSISFLYYSG